MVSELMAQIAEASAEQSRGVQQVNKTVTEMDKVVQQNASAVQQAASAAEAMRVEAGALSRAVSTFQLKGDMGSTIERFHATEPRRDEPKGPPAAQAQRAQPPVEPPRQPALAGPNDEWQEF
jgi:methyl-accepting chemotaxis protein